MAKKILQHYKGPLADYGFIDTYGGGGWLGRNWGNIAQTVGGVALLATGNPMGVGLLAGGASGMASDASQQKSSKEQENANNTQLQIQARLEQAKQYQMAYGGSMEETGTFAPNSLVPLNSPYRHILAKGGHLPEGKATLADAKEFLKLYPEEMAMGIEVEKEHTGNMKLRQRISADHIKDHLKMTGGDPGYYSGLKQSGLSDELNKMALGGMFDFKNGGVYVTSENKKSFQELSKKYGIPSKQAIGLLKNMNEQGFIDPNEPGMRPNFAKGGVISPEKAKKILHDGTIRGKAITEKQRRYFGYMSNKKDGGIIDDRFKELGNYFSPYGEGGPFDSIKPNGNILTSYQGGGTHQENPRGGIPVGKKARVESNEERFDDPDTGESYIFSARF